MPMCGFLVSVESGNSSRISRRGPDCTTRTRIGPFTFVHSLLSITGAFTPQPFVDGDIVCLYNGEIYNHPFSQSDGEVLIPLYRQYGVEFPRHLDGEFAIALYDFAKEIVVFATDPFKTKPLFINGVQCASYRSGVGGDKAKPNEVVVKRFDGSLLDRMAVREWDLSQWKTTYDDWIDQFERAMAKRARADCFLGLSSGYDSGAMACALLELGVRFKAYIYEGQESLVVLEERRRLVDSTTFWPDMSLRDWLRVNIDDESYTIVCDSGPVSKTILEDGASIGLATIAHLARMEGRRVALSGQGSDEIMSDYSPWPDQSTLKGTFPDPLQLWPNFNFSCQESYLMKEEYVAGAFGIENRYPFLDADLVQEFLWLSASAKNRYYKAPLHEYLTRHAFPFEEGAKRGFLIDLQQLVTAPRQTKA